MIWYGIWLTGRVAVLVFALLTWAYGASTYSPFAFDMFVRPQLFPWLETFVNWHHAWYFGAYVISVVTLIPDLVGSGARERPAARAAALAYVLVFLVIGVQLLESPYLRLLTTDTRGPATAFVALMPLAWLAMIDVLATHDRLVRASVGRGATPIPRLVEAILGAAAVIWAAHFARTLLIDPAIRADWVWLAAGAWALALVLTAFAILFALWCLVATAANTRSNPATSEFVSCVFLLAIGLTELFRRQVLPSLSFDPGDAARIAAALGMVVALSWCGMRMRRAVAGRLPLDASLLVSPHVRSRAVLLLMIIAAPLATFAAIDRIEYMDWDFMIQKALTLAEGLLVFGVALQLAPGREGHRLAVGWIAGLPLASLAFLWAVPMVLQAADLAPVRPEILRDRAAAVDPAFRLTSDAFIEHRARDAGFATDLLRYADRSLLPLPSLPAVQFVAEPAPPIDPLPHIFIFVIDGLRRDYLSPYNPAVTFTPAFGRWARDAFVFENAFTRYGGTWLAMPSIWSGAPTRRAWTRDGFARINSLEQLIVSHRYRLAINDYTVSGYLRKETTRTFIDPGVKSINTDICSNVTGIERLLTSDRSPMFSWVAPMNVYVLNAAGAHAADESGFNAAYAANVARVDRCFGEFISFLEKAGLYDNSVIVLSADHGESLGEDGNWGHQFWLFPEDVRIPLIMSLPRRIRPGLTTDLGRVAFSSDLAPTLYRVLGHDVHDLGDLFGAPLVAPAGKALSDRRRQSYLLMSSYGASFGMVRRNGKFLYISDLVNYREHAFELLTQPIGSRVRVSDDLRDVNQALIRARAADIDRFYGH